MCLIIKAKAMKKATIKVVKPGSSGGTIPTPKK